MIGPGPSLSQLPTTAMGLDYDTRTIVVPAGVTGDLGAWLRNVTRMPRAARSSELAELEQEYESRESEIIEKYRPLNVRDDFWETTKPLMLHMNTTQIAMRSYSAVYSGAQSRQVKGEGKFVQELQDFLNRWDYRAGMTERFMHAVLHGTGFASPGWDGENGELSVVVHDPVRTWVWTDPANVRRILAMVEFDRQGRFMRFATRTAAGTLRAGEAPRQGEVVTYDRELPYLMVSLAYGEDRRASGRWDGRSLVRQTPGFNRILTNAYYCLGLLIKWQAKSLLLIMAATNESETNLPGKITQLNGNTALILQKDAKAEFISPMAKFSEILEVVNSYLTFLAVLLGLPKTVFLPQDNVSAQSARLEGAPLVGTLRLLARAHEGYELEFCYRAAAFRHLMAGEVLTMAELRKQYQFTLRIDPWDYTDDLPTTAGTLVSLVNSGLMRLKDAVRRVNPEMPEAEVDAFIGMRQAEIIRRVVDAEQAGGESPAAAAEEGGNA